MHQTTTTAFSLVKSSPLCSFSLTGSNASPKSGSQHFLVRKFPGRRPGYMSFQDMRPDSGFVDCVNCLTGLLKHGFHSVYATHGKGSSFGKETAGLRDKTSELDPSNVALPYKHLATRRDSISAPSRLAAGTKAMVSPSVIRP